MPWPTFPGHAAILPVGAARPMRLLPQGPSRAARRGVSDGAGSAAAVGEFRTALLSRGCPYALSTAAFVKPRRLLVSYVPLSQFP